MTLAKAITRTLDIDVEDVKIDLTATIKSYDLTDTKFIFDIRSSQGLTIDLTGGTAMYIVEYVHNSQTYAIQGDITVVNSTKISFNLPEDLKGYKGTVLIGLYVRLTDGTKIDIKDIAVRIEPSIMDKDIDFTAKTYFEDFESIKAEVVLEGEKAKTAINNVVSDVNGYADSQKQAINDIVTDVQTVGDTAKEEIRATLPSIQTQVSELKSDLRDVFSVQKNIFSEAELLKRGAYASPNDDGSIYLNTNESYSAYRLRVSENSKYTFTNAKFWYRADGSSKAIGELQTNGTAIDSENAHYIIFSFNHEDYPTDSFKIVKGETLETGVIFTKESGIPKLKADVELLKGRDGRFVAKANSMVSKEYITLPTTNVNRNHVYAFSAKITNSSDFRLRISHGTKAYMSSFVDITPTDVNVVNCVPSMVNSPHVHGLSIGEYIKVIINVKDHNDATISISSGGNTYTFADKWYGFNNSQPMVYVFGGSFAECEFTISFEEIRKDLFMFGDSYFGTENNNRWVSYLVDNGFTNQLINAYPGESSSEAEIALNNLLNVATPKYILWCLGMNDGSDTTTYTAKWKRGIDVVLAHCSRFGIKPIFATIPTVPTINHEKKNAYIRALCEARQYDFIDFAKAVGSDENGDWYSGMLSPDGIHPTELGAFALYSQAIIDCPKLIEK